MKYTRDDVYKALNNIKKEYNFEVGELEVCKKEEEEFRVVYERLKDLKKDKLSTGVFASCFWGFNMLWGVLSVVPLVIFGFLTGRSVYNTISTNKKLKTAVKDCEKYFNLVKQKVAIYDKNVNDMSHNIDLLHDVVYSRHDITPQHKKIIKEWIDNEIGDLEDEKQKAAYQMVRDFRKAFEYADNEADDEMER